ncbi:hypothetical protein BKA69DRAFT_127580 [Paraphysoderma sedebokerense]|nr:hypothetical protein BKA69DRAFT_127580 [Paraphysoderma sedebokerense]
MYHNVITWDERIGGYIMDRVQQGCRVYIEGVLEYNEYTDKENNKRKVTNIRLRPGDGKVIITRAAPPAEEMPHEPGQGTAPRGQ